MAHPFEETNLGKAPFRVVDCFDRRGSACHHCGTGIRWNFVIEDTFGTRFIVGSDCVNKTGDTELISDVTKIVKDRQAEQRRAKAAVKRREENAKRKAAMEAGRREWRQRVRAERRENFGDEGLALITEAIPHRHIHKIVRDIIKNALFFGKISPRQINLVRGIIREASAPLVNEWLGSPGDRVIAEVTKLRQFEFESAFGFGLISILRTADGHVVKTFGKCPVKQGETAKVKMTIKKLGDWEGTKETIVNRINVV